MRLRRWAVACGAPAERAPCRFVRRVVTEQEALDAAILEHRKCCFPALVVPLDDGPLAKPAPGPGALGRRTTP